MVLAVTLKVPLYPVGATPATVIKSPIAYGAVACAEKVKVAVLPVPLPPVTVT